MVKLSFPQFFIFLFLIFNSNSYSQGVCDHVDLEVFKGYKKALLDSNNIETRTVTYQVITFKGCSSTIKKKESPQSCMSKSIDPNGISYIDVNLDFHVDLDFIELPIQTIQKIGTDVKNNLNVLMSFRNDSVIRIIKFN